MSQKALELREEAGRLHAEATRKMEEIGIDKMSAEQRAEVDALFDSCEEKIDQAKLAERSANLGKSEAEGRKTEPEQTGGDKPTDNPRGREAYRNAFVSYIRNGESNMSPEMRATLQADSDIGGGFFAGSEQFLTTVLQNVDDAVVIRGLARGFSIGKKDTLGVPTLDSDLGDFEWGSGELTSAVEDTGLSFGKRELKPRDLKRKLIKVSKDLIQSSKIDVEGFVAQRVAIALARTLEKKYMTGDGSNCPLGLFTASSDGISTARDIATGNSATSVTGDGLINAQGMLKQQYQDSARWLFHRDTITQMRKLKDGEGQYIWQPGLQAGTASTILSKPFISSEYAPNTLTTGQYVGLYGDFSYYWYADGMDSVGLQRLIEMYALTGQIGYLFGGMSADGMPVLAEAFVRIKLGA